MAKAEAWVMIPKLDEKKTGCILEMKPLVLCKDCKYAELVCDGCYVCNCIEHDLSSAVNPDWFCADGVRR